MSKQNKATVDLKGVGLTEDDLALDDFDAAEFLTSKESIAAYLTSAFEAGDFAYFQQALNTAARAEGMAKIAADAGITREGVYKSLRAGTEPKMRTIMLILDALGMTLSIVPKATSEESVKNDNSYALAG